MNILNAYIWLYESSFVLFYLEWIDADIKPAEKYHQTYAYGIRKKAKRNNDSEQIHDKNNMSIVSKSVFFFTLDILDSVLLLFLLRIVFFSSFFHNQLFICWSDIFSSIMKRDRNKSRKTDFMWAN